MRERSDATRRAKQTASISADVKAALDGVYPLREVRAGRYDTGCTPGQREGSGCGSESAESTRITHSFLIGETEVTQGLFREVMGRNPSRFSRCGSKCPVDSVSWYDAVAFANALSLREGLEPCYVLGSMTGIRDREVTLAHGLQCAGFRLPTRAEWEVAARGGEDFMYSGSDDWRDVAWLKRNSRRRTHPVGRKKANKYGLHDMSGNVAEWCWDEKIMDSYIYHLPDEPMRNVPTRYVMGGSWSDSSSTAVSSWDVEMPAFGDTIHSVFGFRLVVGTTVGANQVQDALRQLGGS